MIELIWGTSFKRGYKKSALLYISISQSMTFSHDERCVLLNGEIIERTPGSMPYPSCLVLGWLKSGDPLHVKCSMGTSEPKLRIVTVYEPSDAEWESDYKTRKIIRR